MRNLVCTCGIYSIRSHFYNAPFVALTDVQAKEIVRATFCDADNASDFYDFELCRLGTLHMEDGIIDTSNSVVCFVRDVLGVTIYEEENDEISTSV